MEKRQSEQNPENPAKFRQVEISEDQLLESDRKEVAPDTDASMESSASSSSMPSNTEQLQLLLADAENFELAYLNMVVGEDFYDNLTGKKLDVEKVNKAKEKERQNMWKWPVFQKISRKEAIQRNIRLIRSRWVLTAKPDTSVKARWVACELNLCQRDDVWAGTPSSLSHRILLCLALLLNFDASIGDVRAAFLNAALPADEIVAIIPPDGEEQDPDVVYLCLRAIYGLRKSPAYFQEWFAEQLVNHEWVRCVADPCLFCHKATCSFLSHHTDDILLVTDPEHTEQIWKVLQSLMEIRRDHPKMNEEWQSYLGRLWRRGPNCWQTKMKDGYFAQLLTDFDMLQCRAVRSPSWAQEKEDTEAIPLTASDGSKFRMGVGKLQWSKSSRPELSYVVKELATHLQDPTTLDMAHLHRVLRFIQGSQHWVLELRPDFTFDLEHPILMSDSNWAGNEGGKSTSGGLLLLDGFLIENYCKTQSIIALSSCEAELLAINYGASEGFLLCSILEEIGIEAAQLQIISDSSSARQVICRRGLGRLRHMKVRQLWLQDQLRLNTIALVPIASEDNTADIFTKHLTPRFFETHCRALGLKDEAADS